MTMHHFDGVTYQPVRDQVRLNAQLTRVLEVVMDGKWHSLRELSTLTGDPESSVSARLRDLRKPRFGAYMVERNYVGNGLWAYRLVPDNDKKPDA